MKKVVVIGATGFASQRMIPELQKSNICKVVAIQGRDPTKLRDLAERFDITNAYSDVVEMLKKEVCDVVYICTPPHLHLDNITTVANHSPGAAILCEKPIAPTLKDVENIAELIKKHNIKFIVGHHIRHQKAVADLLQILQSKEIGKVVGVSAQWAYRYESTASYAQWKFNKEQGGESVMSDCGIHVIDLLYALFGSPLQIEAAGFHVEHKDVFDTVNALFSYEKFSAVVNASQVISGSSNDLVIFGTLGTIIIPGAFAQTNIRSIQIHSEHSREIRYEETLLYKNEIESLFLVTPSGIAGTTIQDAIEETILLEKIHTKLK